MDRVNSHKKSYIPRSFEAIITKLELGWPVLQAVTAAQTRTNSDSLRGSDCCYAVRAAQATIPY